MSEESGSIFNINSQCCSREIARICVLIHFCSHIRGCRSLEILYIQVS